MPLRAVCRGMIDLRLAVRGRVTFMSRLPWLRRQMQALILAGVFEED